MTGIKTRMRISMSPRDGGRVRGTGVPSISVRGCPVPMRRSRIQQVLLCTMRTKVIIRALCSLMLGSYLSTVKRFVGMMPPST